MKKIAGCFLLFLLGVSASLLAQPYRTGHLTVTFNDAARTGGFGSGGGPGRQIQTEIYYPALTAGNNTAFANGAFPLLVFGHGFAMGWDSYQPFYDSLSRLGYIVALPRTESSAIPFPVHTDFAKDLALLTTKITALNTAPSSPFYQHLNGKVAIAGHSMGGGCTFLADQYTTLPVCYFSFAAAETNPSAVAVAPNTTKPHLVIGGSMDCVAPASGNQDLMYNALASSCKTKAIIDRAYHCQFNANNTTCALGEATCLPSGGLNRSDQLNKCFSLIIPYLDYFLKSDCSAWSRLQQALSAPGITSVSNCVQRVPVAPVVSGDSILCDGQVGTLQVSDTGFVYDWNDGAVGISRNVLTIGRYSARVSNQYCSVNTPEYPVIVYSSPSVAITELVPEALCSGVSIDTFRVQEDTLVERYVWQLPAGWSILSGDSTRSAVIRHNGIPGTLRLQAINRCANGQVAEWILDRDSLPGFTSPLQYPSDTFCALQTGISVQASPTANYQAIFWNIPPGWNIDVTQNTAPVLQAGTSGGTGWVYLLGACGLSDTLYFNLQVLPYDTPHILVSGDTLRCDVPGTFYSWSRNGSIVQSSVSPILLNADDASYQVTVIDLNGCVATSSVLAFVYNGISGEPYRKPGIWYNHAQKRLVVDPEMPSLELYTVEGRWLQSLSSGQEVPVSHLAPGVYVYRASHSQHTPGKLLIW